MSSRMIWSLNALLFYAATLIALLGWTALHESEEAWRLAHGVAYAALGLLLLGALARTFPQAPPNVWRVAGLAMGAVAAALGLWVTQRFFAAIAVQTWMAALVGLSCAMLLPRWLPKQATRRWLAIERRQTQDL